MAFGGSGLIIWGLTFILSVSEIWPEKGAAFGGSGLIIGGLTFILSVSEIWPDKRGGWSSVGVALKEGD